MVETRRKHFPRPSEKVTDGDGSVGRAPRPLGVNMKHFTSHRATPISETRAVYTLIW